MFFAPPELRPAESIKVWTSGVFRGLPRQLDEHSNPKMEMLTVKRRSLVTKLLLVVWIGFTALATADDNASHLGRDGSTPSYFSTYPPVVFPPLDPKAKAALEATAGPSAVDKTPVAEIRHGFSVWRSQQPQRQEPLAGVDNRTVPGPHGAIPVRIYTPEGVGPFPLLVYFHGGGWTVGDLDTHDEICRVLCRRLGAAVMAVHYRLSPENKFPVPLDDCYAALKWADAHAAELKADRTRLAVAGDSAGGNLAAAVALYARDHGGPALSHQVLIYPVTNCEFDTASYWENAVGYGLTRDAMIWFWDNYLANPADGNNPYASPLRAKDLKGLPRALIITAQYDPLRDEAEAYGARLHQAGVPVRVTRYSGMTHGFVLSLGQYEQADHAIEQIAESLRSDWW
jgi:acetyl esterase/lipase